MQDASCHFLALGWRAETIPAKDRCSFTSSEAAHASIANFSFLSIPSKTDMNKVWLRRVGLYGRNGQKNQF
jgi:hypothetical protein